VEPGRSGLCKKSKTAGLSIDKVHCRCFIKTIQVRASFNTGLLHLHLSKMPEEYWSETAKKETGESQKPESLLEKD